ncbi:hypothetical protein [Ornithinimicrobium sp. LYQ103]|uniref:hypothetical protein n=1 Tax=Ornithinimicrobium sp. LYQ103 TaxID=3378796 RepID=UPI003855601B
MLRGHGPLAHAPRHEAAHAWGITSDGIGSTVDLASTSSPVPVAAVPRGRGAPVTDYTP